MQIQSKNDSLKDPPMFVNTGGGGKGIRPNQHNQQQQQQAQQHHHHQSHHQSHHQQHQQHQQQQPQLQTGSLHQTSSQSSGNSHPHPHQQQAAAPQPQPHPQPYPHHQLQLQQFYQYAISPIHPQTAGQNATSNGAGSQLAPSPPTHAGGNGSQGTSMAGGAVTGGGGVGAVASNTAGNTGSSGRQGNTTNTMSHYSAGNQIMQGTLPPPANSHFMTQPFMQLQQQNTVMVAAQYSNAAVAAAAAAGQHGNPSAGQTGATLYQAQQAQASVTHPSHMHYQMTATAGLHHPQHQHQMRNMMTQRPGFYLVHNLTQQRSSLLPNTHQQPTAGSGGSTVHIATQLQNAGTRGAAAGPTQYAPQPFCTPPIQMGAATAMAAQTQPLLASSGIGPPLLQNAYCPLTGAAAPSTSSTSLNLSSLSGAGGPASSSTGTDHRGTKTRSHAIPIINPLTMETVKFELQSKGSAALDIKAPTETENKPAKTSTVILTAPPELEKAAKENDMSSTVSVECIAADSAAQHVDAAATDKIDQQMQTDVIKDNKTSTPPLPEAAPMESTQPQCVVSAQTTGIEENDDTDADTPELEHDDDAYINRSEVIDSSPLQAAASIANDNTISRDCGNQLPVMDSDDTDQTTETDVKSMSQMDDDNNCKRLQSEDEHQQKQQLDVDSYQVVAPNNVNDNKPVQIPTNVNISVERPKEQWQEVNETNETDDSITIQRKTVAANDKDNAVVNTDSNSIPAKTEEPTKSSKSNISGAAPHSNANINNNNNNKIQPISVDSHMRNVKSNATPKAVEGPSAAQQLANDDSFITVSSRKNRKVAAKRNAKENVKKPAHQTQMTQQQSHRTHAAERSNSTTSNNSNSNNRSHNNNNTRNTSATATNVLHHHLTDIHNANSSIPPSNNNRNGNKQQQQQPSQTTPNSANNNNVNVEATVKGGLNVKESENNGKNIKTQEIAEQLKHSSSPEGYDNAAAATFATPTIATPTTATPTTATTATTTTTTTASKHDEQQVQFLNSNSPTSEYEEEQQQQQQQQSHKQPEIEADATLQNVRFADFKENKKLSEVENKAAAASKSRASPDAVDCSSTQVTHGRTAIASKPSKDLHVVTPTIEKPLEEGEFRRYSLETLKSLAKDPKSSKVPEVACQKGDCVSQLFVSQQNKHNSAQSVGGNHMPQPYQQMNFHENMEFIGGKRRSQQRKQHDHQSITSSCGNIAGVGGAAGGSSVGMTGGSVSVTGTSFARPVRMIRVNLSLNEEIKLSESENAWQPSTLGNKPQDPTGGSDSVEATVKKVRGVLNKLTPENFDVLLKTMTSISLDSSEKMQSVMILIFEKTISEPNFAPTYAKFCQVLFQEVKPESKSQFTTSIIKRIQTEFEDNVNMADAKKKTLQPLVDKLKTSTDPKERLEIEAEIEEKEYQFRRRAWGTVRFIGEMYKLKQLTPDRVMMCVESLQDHGSEEKLEYMCKLLTTVGHLIDDTAAKNFVGRERLDKVFQKINDTVKNTRPNSSGKNSNKITISSRVRFMMQDVLDLRLRHWDQNQTQSHASKNVPSVSSGGGGGGSSSQHQQRRRNQDEKNNRNNYDRGGSSQRMGYSGSNSQRQNRLDRDGGGGNYYSKNSQKSNFQQDDKVIDFKKFSFSKCEEPSSDTQLGNSLAYKWRVCGKPTVGPMQNTTAPPIGGMPSASSQRSSGNNSSSANNSVKRQTNPFQALSTKESDAERPSASQTSASSSSNEESDIEEKSISANAAKDYRKQINGFVEEFLDCAPTNIFDWQSNALSTWRSNTLKQQVELMYYLLTDYLHLRQVTKVERSACAAVFLYLLRTKAFDKKTFGKAYDQFAEEFPDVLLDVPTGWTYVFEFLGPLLHDRLLSFEDIWRDFWNEYQVFTERFVKAFVAHFTKEFGANYIRDLWHKEYNLERGQMFIADQKKASDFFDSQGLKFLFDNKVKPIDDFTSCCSTTDDQKIKRLEVLLKGGNNCDLAIDYINTNVNINSSFIKILTHFLCCDYATVMTPSSGSSSTKKDEDASKTPQFNMEMFSKCCQPLLKRCIDAQEEYEVICLDTVYESTQKNHDSKTASEFTWNIFDALYECEVISKDCFDKWYKKHNSRGGQLSAQLQAYMQKIL